MIIDIRRILAALPHRYPFLLVDRIVEFEPDKRIVGLKNVTINEPFFPGHFPGNPVMPGVLIIEALAQAGAMMLLVDKGEEAARNYFYLAGIDKARFRRPVVPGDALRLEMKLISARRRFCKMRGVATVDGEVAAEAEVMSMLVAVEDGGAA